MLLLVNADVFAPQPLGPTCLLIGGERILWMGDTRPDLPAALGVAVHDCGGRRVIPGLIDGHVHVTGGGGEAGYETRVPPQALSQLTTAGITTAIGLLGTDDITRDTGSLVATTRALCAEGLTAYCYTGGYHVPPRTLTGSVRGDIVHVDRIIGVGEVAVSDHRSSQPTTDELLRLASEAHVAGLMTGKAGILHLHLGDGERGLAPLRECLTSEIPHRVFHPTHVNRRRALFEEALELTRESSCSIDVTAFPDDDGEAISAAEAWQRYHEADGPPERITISSDGGGCMPVFDAEGRPTGFGVGRPALLAQTLESLLNAGHPLDSVLPAFTSNVADLLRLPDKGRIGRGAAADLVVLDEQNRIGDVMARGRWHVRDGVAEVLGTFEGRDE